MPACTLHLYLCNATLLLWVLTFQRGKIIIDIASGRIVTAQPKLSSNERNRGAEPESESESPGVVATSKELESESIKLPRLRLRNVLFESVV